MVIRTKARYGVQDDWIEGGRKSLMMSNGDFGVENLLERVLILVEL